ncbi:YigZ family protein [uncultured Duncaniella sp.]|uniref:IMPACT family protein n=2 Tax=uncultured Duncaniella sp. TaxID=2768039 RepID=UPI002675CF8E|nr:YigZ family protein [uncultured Duncaniella sp.]
MAKFFTIGREGEGVYREKMSRFLAFALPATSIDEAKECIALYANKYHDARHVCWAYMIGADRLTYLSSDNGEPSGTAGKPILGQINSLGLTNVVVIVVRYFGGIKLGTSGLIVAYREAARLALEDAGTVEGREMTTMSVIFPYLAMNDVMKLVKGAPASDAVSIVSQEFDNTCRLTLSLPLDILPSMAGRLDAISGTSVECPENY